MPEEPFTFLPPDLQERFTHKPGRDGRRLFYDGHLAALNQTANDGGMFAARGHRCRIDKSAMPEGDPLGNGNVEFFRLSNQGVQRNGLYFGIRFFRPVFEAPEELNFFPDFIHHIEKMDCVPKILCRKRRYCPINFPTTKKRQRFSGILPHIAKTAQYDGIFIIAIFKQETRVIRNDHRPVMSPRQSLLIEKHTPRRTLKQEQGLTFFIIGFDQHGDMLPPIRRPYHPHPRKRAIRLTQYKFFFGKPVAGVDFHRPVFRHSGIIVRIYFQVALLQSIVQIETNTFFYSRRECLIIIHRKAAYPATVAESREHAPSHLNSRLGYCIVFNQAGISVTHKA